MEQNCLCVCVCDTYKSPLHRCRAMFPCVAAPIMWVFYPRDSLALSLCSAKRQKRVRCRRPTIDDNDDDVNHHPSSIIPRWHTWHTEENSSGVKNIMARRTHRAHVWLTFFLFAVDPEAKANTHTHTISHNFYVVSRDA